MELVKTTAKIAENRKSATNQITVNKQNLDEYKVFTKEILSSIENIQQEILVNKKALAVHKYTSDTFENDAKNLKKFIGIIHKDAGEVKKQLDLIRGQDNVVEQLYNENEAVLAACNANYEAKLKRTWETLKGNLQNVKDEKVRLSTTRSSIETQISEIEENWDLELEVYQADLKNHENLLLEIDITNDGMKEVQDDETRELEAQQEQCREELRERQELTVELADITKQLFEEEDQIIEIMKGLQRQYVVKDDITGFGIEAKTQFEELIRKFELAQAGIQYVESQYEERKKMVEARIQSEIRFKESKEIDLQKIKEKEAKISQELDTEMTNLNALESEINDCSSKCQQLEQVCAEINRKIENIELEHDVLNAEIAKYNTLVDKHNTNLEQITTEIQALEDDFTLKLAESEEKIKQFEPANLQVSIEQEIESYNVKNKTLQTSTTQIEEMLRSYEERKIKMTQERDDNHTLTTILAKKIENYRKQMQRTELENAKKKIVPETPRKIMKLPSKVFKRPISKAEDSDTSVDEGPSYADFRAKRRMLSQRKKQ